VSVTWSVARKTVQWEVDARRVCDLVCHKETVQWEVDAHRVCDLVCRKETVQWEVDAHRVFDLVCHKETVQRCNNSNSRHLIRESFVASQVTSADKSLDCF